MEDTKLNDLISVTFKTNKGLEKTWYSLEKLNEREDESFKLRKEFKDILVSIELPKTIKNLPKYAFDGCT